MHLRSLRRLSGLLVLRSPRQRSQAKDLSRCFELSPGSEGVFIRVPAEEVDHIDSCFFHTYVCEKAVVTMVKVTAHSSE